MCSKTKLLLMMVLLSSVMLIGGCASDNIKTAGDSSKPVVTPSAEQKQAVVSQPNASQTSNEMQLTIYFASPDAMYVVPYALTVAKNDQPAQTAVELLLAGPKTAEVLAVFPQEVKLKGISIKDNIAYVDFNDKLLKNKVGGSAGEMLLVGALVNTLTEFPDIKKVQILVDGKKIETISGHMDTAEPLGRMEKIIKR